MSTRLTRGMLLFGMKSTRMKLFYSKVISNIINNVLMKEGDSFEFCTKHFFKLLIEYFQPLNTSLLFFLKIIVSLSLSFELLSTFVVGFFHHFKLNFFFSLCAH